MYPVRRSLLLLQGSRGAPMRYAYSHVNSETDHDWSTNEYIYSLRTSNDNRLRVVDEISATLGVRYSEVSPFCVTRLSDLIFTT